MMLPIRSHKLIDFLLIKGTYLIVFNLALTMRSAADPRLLELKRLQAALDAASKHLDEFESRAQRAIKGRSSRAPAKSVGQAENAVALRIMIGMEKLRQDR